MSETSTKYSITKKESLKYQISNLRELIATYTEELIKKEIELGIEKMRENENNKNT